MSAAISFYSLISLVPLITVIITISGFAFGQEAIEGEIVKRLDEKVGTEIAQMIQSLILKAHIYDTKIVTALIAVVVFIWSSLAVFVEARDSLNTIWGVEVKPGKSLKEFFTGRLFSLFILGLIGFFFIITLLTSTLFNIADSILSKYIGDILPTIYMVNSIVSFILLTILFAFMFKFLPSLKVEWKYITIGAIVTSVLFTIGKMGIGFYLSKSIYSRIYGAEGSMILLLIWIYYSSLIFFFGAELTQVIQKDILPIN
jgi:membrane protein